eukprot:jgi/Ulvmu1/5044/UM021_0061.1
MGCSASKIQDGVQPASMPVVKAPEELGQEPVACAPAQTAAAASEMLQGHSSSEEHAAACKVQSAYRGHAARKRVDGIRAEKNAKSLAPEAPPEGANHADAPNVDNGKSDTSVSHDVDNALPSVGQEGSVPPPAPDENVPNSPDNGAAAVVQIFGEEGANAVAAAFFDGEAATDAPVPADTEGAEEGVLPTPDETAIPDESHPATGETTELPALAGDTDVEHEAVSPDGLSGPEDIPLAEDPVASEAQAGMEATGDLDAPDSESQAVPEDVNPLELAIEPECAVACDADELGAADVTEHSPEEESHGDDLSGDVPAPEDVVAPTESVEATLPGAPAEDAVAGETPADGTEADRTADT